jgi:hypothetical protein
VLVGTLLATWIGTGSIFGNAQKTYQIGVGAFVLPVAGTLGIFAAVVPRVPYPSLRRLHDSGHPGEALRRWARVSA